MSARRDLTQIITELADVYTMYIIFTFEAMATWREVGDGIVDVLAREAERQALEAFIKTLGTDAAKDAIGKIPKSTIEDIVRRWRDQDDLPP